MKTKKINKKLSLTKNTITRLNDAHMTALKGGVCTGQSECILCVNTQSCVILCVQTDTCKTEVILCVNTESC